MKLYKFLKDHGGYKKGARVQFSDKEAKPLLEAKAIALHGDEKATKQAEASGKK